MQWVTIPQAAAIWPDVAHLPLVDADQLLADAQAAVEAYAPPLAEGATEAPGHYRRAVVLHARDLHMAARRTGDRELVGPDAYAIQVRPLSDTVKALVRPARGALGLGLGL